MPDANHNDASSLREQYLEYGFLGELCREMWKRGIEMDILRSHTDRSGYDILLEANGVERHVQMKSSFVGAKTARASERERHPLRQASLTIIVEGEGVVAQRSHKSSHALLCC